MSLFLIRRFFRKISHRQLIDEVVNGRENAKLTQLKLQQYKADFVKQYKEELKQLMKQALEEVRRELRKGN